MEDMRAYKHMIGSVMAISLRLCTQRLLPFSEDWGQQAISHLVWRNSAKTDAKLLLMLASLALAQAWHTANALRGAPASPWHTRCVGNQALYDFFPCNGNIVTGCRSKWLQLLGTKQTIPHLADVCQLGQDRHPGRAQAVHLQALLVAQSVKASKMRLSALLF